MIPLALDFTSTLVIGSILPVATTDLVIVPRSTVAIEVGIEVGAGAGGASEQVDAGQQADGRDRAAVEQAALCFLTHLKLLLSEVGRQPGRASHGFAARPARMWRQ